MRRDFNFDVVDHFETAGHFARLDFRPDPEQRYDDRITGSVMEGPPESRFRVPAVIYPRAVGSDNADRFSRWVTMSPAQWQAITTRPRSWRFFVAMVGLLPDGTPWWSRVYEESVLAELRDHSEQMGGFYRFDPGLTDKALASSWHLEQPEQGLPFRFVISDAGGGQTTTDPAEFAAAIQGMAMVDNEPMTGRVDITPGQLSLHFE